MLAHKNKNVDLTSLYYGIKFKLIIYIFLIVLI